MPYADGRQAASRCGRSHDRFRAGSGMAAFRNKPHVIQLLQHSRIASCTVYIGVPLLTCSHPHATMLILLTMQLRYSFLEGPNNPAITAPACTPHAAMVLSIVCAWSGKHCRRRNCVDAHTVKLLHPYRAHYSSGPHQ